MTAAFDIIGDIHGHAGKLEDLLGRLGYARRGGAWRPPADFQAIFIGDLIDRGPEQLAVCRIVRAMIDNGDARCVLGNHELNAIGYRTPSIEEPGSWLRPRTDVNTRQHAAFLRQAGLGTPVDTALVDWFRTLPFSLDLGGLRIVHAWWNDAHLQCLARIRPADEPLDEALLYALYARGSAERAAMEALTKGEELELPAGAFVLDHAGDRRTAIRSRWWDTRPRTYRELALVPVSQRDAVPDVPLPAGYRATPPMGTPVFIGHYWLTGVPAPLTPQLACVDYSAARSGPLVAYRWTGESALRSSAFVASAHG